MLTVGLKSIWANIILLFGLLLELCHIDIF